ncbi:FAD binding domain-containing protein [Fusarium heterosporum]|uniref:FAD binding domain-containing protein n=1 Tax=Fusarium heterosporum TaxID=42747 RepID=A0A8H5TF01_FUSHE|nr:FAD binding domain-containing protein [Fusarium heterosporum]
MTTNTKSFRVLIAGGGVAGLTLANMLERFDIDYLVLEGHGEIAPAVGASIGMFPNGLRILDQIDLYEPLKDLVNPEQETQSTRDMSGKPIVSIPRFQNHVVARHGYPLMFFDRQCLLQVLYERLTHKHRVLLNHKVDNVDLVDDGVEVTMANGQKLEGSILVGADGVHSAVRRHMFRLGQQLSPESFQTDDLNKQECHYLCSYGIAQDVPGWVPSDQCTVLGEGHSQLVVSGPDRKTYWFFFSKLPETKHGADIPMCSKETEEEFVRKYAEVAITEKVTFGQVYANRLFSTLTPLHEYVFDKWFFNRIICLGDSMHKPNPIGGQGGNGAIESAAELVNALMKRKHSLGSLEAFSDKDVEIVFSEMQSRRHERAKRIVFASHLQQSLVAYEKPGLSKFVWQLLVPLKGDEAALSLFGLSLAGASRLDILPLKKRPRAIPYRDELPASLLQNVLLTRSSFAAMMAYIFYKSLHVKDVSASLPGSPHNAMQSLSPIVVYILEGYRLGNGGTPLVLPSLFFFAAQYYGFHRVQPIYAIVHALMGLDSPTGRYVRPEVVVSMLASLTATFVLPNIVSDSDTQPWVTVSNFAPVITSVMTLGIAYGLRCWRNRGLTSTEKSDTAFERYTTQDLGLLKFAYGCTGLIQAVLHVYQTLSTYANLDSGLQVLTNLPQHVSAQSHLLTLNSSESILGLSSWCSNVYSIWNLRRLGLVTTREAISAGLCLTAGQCVVGSGAAWMGVWYWRENVFAKFLASSSTQSSLR